MKRALLYFVIALCIMGSVRADQTVQSVQQTLKDQGFYYGNVTGDKSAETTAAIRRYQIRNGLPVTGEINPETLRSLNLSSNAKSVPSSQPSSNPAIAQSNNAHPAETPRLDQNSGPPSATDQQRETTPGFDGAPYQSAPPRPNSRVVAEAKYQLMARGYFRGRVSGRYGRHMTFAVRAFQLQSGLSPTGRLDTATLQALGLSDANLASLEPARDSYETWVPITKYKHGRWKVKWKKVHRQDRDEYAHEGQDKNGDAWRHIEDRDD